MSARKLRTRSPQTHLLRLSPVPHLVNPQQAALFARADHWAAEILRAFVTQSKDSGPEQIDDAIADLTRRSSYYKEADERRQETADLMIACNEAGFLVGVAIGLRLRGAA